MWAMLQRWPCHRLSLNKRSTPNMNRLDIIWSQLVNTQHGGCRSSSDNRHQTINNTAATTPILIVFNCFTWYKKDHQQCSLYLVVNSGTTDFASRLGTDGLITQNNFDKGTTKRLVKCMKNWNISVFISTCHIFFHRNVAIFFNFPLFESWFCNLFVSCTGRLDSHVFYTLSRTLHT